MTTIYNMPSGVPFLRSLAHGLHARFGDALQDGLVLLPTRRAARALEFAFVQQAAERGLSAALLPRLRPLADVNPDEPPFEPGELAGRVAPGIDPVQRRFEIAQLVARYHKRATDMPLDPAAALHMADPLMEIIDDAALEEVRIRDHAEWKRVCNEAAIHFQHAGRLYQIVETHWPDRLAEMSMMEPAARRVALLDAMADLWSERPPAYPVIVAGSTGTLKATARLMKTVAEMPDGMVVLPGLQEDLPDRVWDAVDVRHPQSSLKTLLETMEVSRADVPAWPWVVDSGTRPLAKKRRRILAEALVPVDATGDWLGRIDALTGSEGADVFETALSGLSLIEARTDDEEALAIALILRETLETESRTAALVTPDQLLAQRVRARLSRWGVDVAMSQGVPVEQTPIGVFLTALLEFARDPSGPVEINLVMSNAFTALERPVGDAGAAWERLERKHYRGLRPSAEETAGHALVAALRAATAPLLELGGSASPDAWATALVAAAEAVASTDEMRGTFRLWGSDAGRQAANVLEGIVSHGFALPDTDAEGFSRLLSSLLRGAVVRPSQGTHPRLSILGPLEARLLDADVVILGGLNEGTWPGAVNAGPFLSRGMREVMRLSLPERRYGLAAHDFAELAANGTVFLTRSQKSDSGPTVASRWVWRLKTLLRGAMPDAKSEALLGTGQHYLDWARALDHCDRAQPVGRPNPKPPVEKRWARKGREISITGVSTWIRDPYSLFGREVLRLKRLDPLDAPMDARHFGTAMHKAVEDYLNRTDVPGDPSNRSILTAHFLRALGESGVPDAEVRKERARVEFLSGQLIDWFASRQARGYDVVGTEVEARHVLDDLGFTLIGVLDLVERSPTGYAFHDFKTGSPPTANTVAAGFDLQLPLAGWLASEGALDGHGPGATEAMGYVRLKGSGGDFKATSAVKTGKDGTTPKALMDDAVKILRALIEAFDKPDTGYPSQPRAQYTHDYGEYDNLARRAEWSAVSGDGGEA
ncbi:MAG: PD-(D/E)XK nuclease family protein [Pseudomonadota bacterium]